MDLSKLKKLRNQRFSLTCPTTHAITKKSEVFKLEGIIVNSYNNNYNNRVNTYYSNVLIYGNRIAKSCNDVMKETHRNLEKNSTLIMEQLENSKFSVDSKMRVFLNSSNWSPVEF